MYNLNFTLFEHDTSMPTVRAQPRVPVASRPEIKVTAAKPNRIVIPRLEIDLPISDGEYNPSKKTWTLSDNHAHFALPSTMPNDYEGNTLIYGHNYGWVFGDLKSLRTGDTMQLFTDSNYVFTYVYQDTQKLKPDDNSVFRYEGYPSVSVQTCSGRFNENRQMFNFSLEEVSAL
jgi:LPXTG-site transpeptidase (sortase) family protein